VTAVPGGLSDAELDVLPDAADADLLRHAHATADQRSAEISPCGRYRYALTRRWSYGPTVGWVMLNPSTADGTVDDPTLRRVTAFSRAWGYGGLVVANLYAFRATKPADLRKAADPIGPDNDEHLTSVAAGCDRIVAAWGAHARPGRIAAVLALPGMDRLTALALTKNGQPRHPLYLRGDLVPQAWSPR
jgi:hypothetical protein